MIFVDTNYFLRLILKDVEDQYLVAYKFFKEAKNKDLKLVTSDLTIFEIFFTLKNHYKKDKSDLIEILDNIFKISSLYVDRQVILEEALVIFTNNNIEFQDSYNLAFARISESKDFKTFDKKLIKVWG